MADDSAPRPSPDSCGSDEPGTNDFAESSTSLLYLHGRWRDGYDMERTDAQRLRRQVLASASVLAPAQVILYLQAPGGTERDVDMGRLRRYAGARDWAVIAELIDRAPHDTPMARRPGWWRLERLIVRGDATGVITPDYEAVRYLDDHLSFRDWLADRYAFLEITEPTR